MKSGKDVKLIKASGSVILVVFVFVFVGYRVEASEDWGFFNSTKFITNENLQSNVCHDNKSFFVGCPTPRFTSLPDITDLRPPEGMALADFNRDGKLDLVTSATGSSTASVSVRFGNNDGSFQSPPAYYLAGNLPSAIAVGDFDGINGLDLVVATSSTASQSRSRFAVLLNLGNGTFTPVNSTQCTNNDPHCPGGADQIQNVAVGRIDNDNNLDVVVSDLNTRHALIYFGSGNGTFSNPLVVNFTTGSGGANFVALADMDGDGDQDLLGVLSSGEVQIISNNGNGTFQSVPVNIVPVGNAPKSLTIADFDGVRGLDFATADSTANTISVKLRNVSGGFSNAAGSPYSVSPFNPQSIAAADFNLDGQLDLVTANSSSAGFSVLLGNPGGSFGTSFNSTLGNTPSLVFAGDITGDNRADIVLANGTDGNVGVGVKKNICDSSPLGRKQFDFDGDNKADVSVFRSSNSVWYVLRSSDNNVLTTQWGIASDKIVPADYNGDGKTDYAVFRDGFWYILLNGGGFQGFQWGAVGDIPFPADFDGDGKEDLAVFRNGTWFVLKSSGGTTTQNWGSAGDIPVVADYDGDGKADFAVYRNGIWYVLFSGGGNTAIQWGIAGDKPVQSDYNGDGKADYAVFRNGFWYILLNGGGFQGAQWGTTGDVAAPADYDGDGKTDLAVFRAGTWYIQRTTAGVQVVNFGSAGDKPVPNAFVP